MGPPGPVTGLPLPLPNLLARHLMTGAKVKYEENWQSTFLAKLNAQRIFTLNSVPF